MRNTHITDMEWRSFWQQQLGEKEQTELLEHVCDCELCSAKMADGIPQNWQLTTPAYFKEETVQYVKERTRLQRFFNRRHLQLFTYSFKVSMAMAVAILFLLRIEFPPASLPESNPKQTTWEESSDFSITDFLNDGTNYINQKLNTFSSSFFNKEDIDNEK